MEVRVAATDGGAIPEGCVINICVGDTQKQARYDPRKAYRFADVKNHAKLEIYQLVGACDVVWQAGEKPETQMCWPHNAGFSLNVTMGRLASTTTGKAGDAAKDDKKDLANAARQFLRDQDVERTLTEAMRAMLKSMPDDAHGFLADYIRRHAKEPDPAAKELRVQLQDMQREHEQVKARLKASEEEARLLRQRLAQQEAAREGTQPPTTGRGPQQDSKKSVPSAAHHDSRSLAHVPVKTRREPESAPGPCVFHGLEDPPEAPAEELSDEEGSDVCSLSSGEPPEDRDAVLGDEPLQAGAELATLAPAPAEKKRRHAGKLGVIRLDYDYPPAPGDIDCPDSFAYEVVYKVVPGLTFEMIQANVYTHEVEEAIDASIKYLEQAGVHGVTGDCGFMMYLQQRLRRFTRKPVFMSALAQLPTLDTAFSLQSGELIAVLTANGQSLLPMRDMIREECGIDMDDAPRFVFVGCEDVPGFEAVAEGGKVDVDAVTPGIVAKVQGVIAANPAVKCIVMECTELPPYSDAVRFATGLPVYDAITCVDYFMSGYCDNERFGMSDWQHVWSGEYEQKYQFGANLCAAEKACLVNKAAGAVVEEAEPDPDGEVEGARAMQVKKRRKGCLLGVIRLDYDYPPSPGDIDCPDSFPYEVVYRVVPGLTFGVAQSGEFTEEVLDNFKAAINFLEGEQVHGITGDCGFMMYLQEEARRYTTKPVFMSALAQLPMLDTAFSMARGELIMVLTANEKSLHPMRQLIRTECGIDMDDGLRFVFVGCENVDGFEAVALSQKVDVERVTPGIVKLVKEKLLEHPDVTAILMECTELPPYSDAVRHATSLPVYDAITCCDYFMSGFQDNERFGLADWQFQFDGEHQAYQFGENLTARQRKDLVNKGAPQA